VDLPMIVDPEILSTEDWCELQVKEIVNEILYGH
jgi:hypothetical protein